jgi:hypothetical protein
MTRAIRHRVDPGDVPPEKAARRLGLTAQEFALRLPELLARGFPQADPTTGNYDLDAIDAWRRLRHPHLFQQQLTSSLQARDARSVVAERVARLRSG